MTLRPFLNAFLAAAIATALVQLKFPRADVLLEHMLEPTVFAPATIIFLAALGVAFYRCVPGGRLSWFSRDLQLHHRAFAVYSPVAGALAGWAVCLCIFQYGQFGSPALPAITVAILFLVFLVGIPVASYVAISPVITQFQGHGPTPRRYPRLVKLLGVAIVATCAVGFLLWWRGG